MICVREAGIHLIAHLLAKKAATGNVDREPIHCLRQIHFAFVAKGIGEHVHLLEHDAGEALHRRLTQRWKQES